MRNRGFDPSPFPENVVRFEYRLVRHEKIKKVLDGVQTAGDLLSIYDDLPEFFRRTMRESVFKFEVNIARTDEVDDELSFYRAQGGKWLQTYLIDSCLSVLDSTELRILKDQIQKQTRDRSKVYWLQKRFEGAVLRKHLAGREARSGQRFQSLYEELKNGVLAA
jgi:hypothetical protein